MKKILITVMQCMLFHMIVGGDSGPVRRTNREILGLKPIELSRFTSPQDKDVMKAYSSNTLDQLWRETWHPLYMEFIASEEFAENKSIGLCAGWNGVAFYVTKKSFDADVIETAQFVCEHAQKHGLDKMG